MKKAPASGRERRKSWLLIELIHRSPEKGGRAKVIFWTPAFEPAPEWRGSLADLRAADLHRIGRLVETVTAAHARVRRSAAERRAFYADAMPVAQHVRELFLLQRAEKIIREATRQEAE